MEDLLKRQFFFFREMAKSWLEIIFSSIACFYLFSHSKGNANSSELVHHQKNSIHFENGFAIFAQNIYSNLHLKNVSLLVRKVIHCTKKMNKKVERQPIIIFFSDSAGLSGRTAWRRVFASS